MLPADHQTAAHSHTSCLQLWRIGGSSELAALDVPAIEAQLRGALLKLQYADSYLRKLPANCTFEVVAYTTGGRAAGSGSSGGGVPQDAWVEEQPGPAKLELEQVGAGAIAQLLCLVVLGWLVLAAHVHSGHCMCMLAMTSRAV